MNEDVVVLAHWVPYLLEKVDTEFGEGYLECKII